MPPSGAAPAATPGPPGDDLRQRPFILTGGRVGADDREIDLETQVTVRPHSPYVGRVPLEALGPEMQAIVALCAEPISVAEISARMRLHLGVTKVLVADLRAVGYLDVHVADVVSGHSADTILRVMQRLRAIS
ncbi:DUF742 domain-containing protein [Actinoplanes sp. TRM 88003]|uniref:DUF742 domain-containing protein n=1 Tax=Paractinoplanes aksuensis TaxID=2939490 RepID=A0ABT1DWZ4_9ACTN|nr:DUF742 domain-containing protein [Actinoplanes aksuensis]MCO8275388.1 DUF742 domain-containing protein [Actinoplanes aksuensis]